MVRLIIWPIVAFSPTTLILLSHKFEEVTILALEKLFINEHKVKIQFCLHQPKELEQETRNKMALAKSVVNNY